MNNVMMLDYGEVVKITTLKTIENMTANQTYIFVVLIRKSNKILSEMHRQGFGMMICCQDQ